MKVLKRFRDKQTNKLLEPGETWRCDDTSRVKLAVKKGLIEPPKEEVETAAHKVVKENAKVNHVGGGWYELPNGERIQGKEEAEKALRGD